MNGIITAFFDDFAGNDRALRVMGYEPGSRRLERLRAEAARDGLRTWVRAEPVDGRAADLAGRIGVVVSRAVDGWIDRPVCIRRIAGEYWIASRERPIARFDGNWSYLGDWRGWWREPNSGNGYAWPASIAADEAAGRLYIAMPARNIVRAFDLETGAQLWQYGQSGRHGNLRDGRLGAPVDVDVLPNGNVLVCDQTGWGNPPGQDAWGPGHLTELDGASGALVACRVRNAGGGNPWNGGVSGPVRARVLGGRVYASLYDRHMIGCWDIDADTGQWSYRCVYTHPPGMDVTGIYPHGLTLNAAGELVVCCDGPKKIVALGEADHDYRWSAGEPGWDDRAAPRNRPGELHGPRDLCETGPGLYAVCDEGNNRVTVLPAYNSLAVPYAVTLPAGYRLVADGLPPGYDARTHELRVRLTGLGGVGPLYLPCEREAD